MAWAYLAGYWLCAGLLFGCGDSKFGGADASTDSSLACTPMAIEACYTGPANTQGVGACLAGTRTCAADGSGFGPCTGEVVPTAETCATVGDDDCDGMANEDGAGCDCTPGSTMACYTGAAGTQNVGVCASGVATCNAQGTGYGACDGEVTPTTETCTTPTDDDCDGQVNEDGAGCVCTPNASTACYTGPAGTENVGVCTGGTKTCNAQGTAYGPCTGEVTPGIETCNTNADDDCDGEVNENGAGCVCTPNAPQSCYSGPVGTVGVGACSAGTRTCNSQGTAFGSCMGEVLPSAESCLTPGDDDCDGLADEGCVCVPNSTVACYGGPAGTQGVGVCTSGTATCNAQGTAYGPCIGEVLPNTESCQTPADDDCDGLANEGCVCVPNSTVACYSGPAGTQGVGVCTGGTATCNAQGTAYGPCTGEITPTTETCNTNGDDDCDGQTNESGAGCVCTPSATQSCYAGPAGTAGVGLCKSGTRTCNAQGTGFGTCTGEVLPATESCATPADDDCDGQANEGCAALSCSFYSENFDDGNAGEITTGTYKMSWCDTVIPTAMNTPLCMLGRTLRTNLSTDDPTMWIYKTQASCTSAKITYSYYQFAASNVTLSYQLSNDETPVCEKAGTFTSLATYPTLQTCVQQSHTIPFSGSSGIYVRFDHGTGTNALWLDNVTVELLGCDC